MSLSIILPTYNESGNITLLIDSLFKVCPSVLEIIVVDDHSPDGTADRVRELMKSYPQLKCVERRERGLVSALNSGLHLARGEWVAWMDCDLSHPPELLVDLIATAKEGAWDAVIASRYAPGGRDSRHGPYRLQNYLSRILSLTSLLMTGLAIRDVTSGYLIVKRKLLSEIGFLKGDYGEYFIDMLHKLHRRGATIKEIPYTFCNRVHGESKTATHWTGYFSRGIRYLLMMMKYSRLRPERRMDERL
ncbi:MAG: polyprenol monophosphomannose synthase [Planctomycetes bacterium]|nr:polyprenol monophosphomannose synthase [Planctomycetota bacterium]